MKKTILIPIMLLLFVSFVSAVAEEYNHQDEDSADTTINGTTSYPTSGTNLATGYGWTVSQGAFEAWDMDAASPSSGDLMLHPTSAALTANFVYNQSIANGTSCVDIFYNTSGGNALFMIDEDSTPRANARSEFGEYSTWLSDTHWAADGSAGGCADIGGDGVVSNKTFPATSQWVEICMEWDGVDIVMLVDGEDVLRGTCAEGHASGGIWNPDLKHTGWDNFRVWEGNYEDEPQAAGETTLNITLINMTSNGGILPLLMKQLTQHLVLLLKLMNLLFAQFLMLMQPMQIWLVVLILIETAQTQALHHTHVTYTQMRLCF